MIKSYRDLLRTARKCEDKDLQLDIVSQIRSEYARHKQISDPGQIKQHLQVASKELKKVQDLCHSISLSKQSSSDKPPADQSSIFYPTSTRISKHTNHPGQSWIDTKDEEDERGRVGQGWPWE